MPDRRAVRTRGIYRTTRVTVHSSYPRQAVQPLPLLEGTRSSPRVGHKAEQQADWARTSATVPWVRLEKLDSHNQEIRVRI